MTPAEELREAALTIRALASAAYPSPWMAPGEPRTPGYAAVPSVCVESPDLDHPFVAVTGRWGTQHPEFRWAMATVAHIELWQPSTALLAADLLDGMADHWASRSDEADLFEQLPLAALVRAINGGA